MYFTLRNHRMYAWAMRLSGVRRYAVTGVSMVILWLLWGYGVYSKNSVLIARYQQEIGTIQTQASQVAEIMQQCVLDEKCVEELKDFMSPYGVGTCDKALAQSRMVEIIKSVKRADLRLLRCHLSQCIDKEWYMKHRIHVDVEGALTSIQRFFTQLKEAPNMIQCSLAHLDRKSSDTFHLSTDMYVVSVKNKIPST